MAYGNSIYVAENSWGAFYESFIEKLEEGVSHQII